jgi:hypothetical protein
MKKDGQYYFSGLFFLCLLMPSITGCANWRLHTEAGYTHPALGGERWIKNENVDPLRSAALAARIEATVIESGTLALDQGIGPMLLAGDQGWLLGAESVTRLRWKATKDVHPYLISTNGFAYTQGWRESDVPYAFTTGLGAGAQWNYSPRCAFTADVRWLHHSNGKSFHGDRTRHLLGLANPDKNGGYQNLGVFFGFVVRLGSP